MPLLDRQVVLDRPVLFGEEDEENNEDSENNTVEQLGNGGGPIIHGLEFSTGDYDLVAASNVAAVIATADENSSEFSQAFRTAAIQLNELINDGGDVSDLTRFGVENGIANIGLTDEQVKQLKGRVDNDDSESDNGDSGGDEDIEEIVEAGEDELESEDNAEQEDDNESE